VRVLDKAHPKGIKRGHLWSLVSDDAVVYFYTPNWKGEPIQELLKNFDGVLQSDGYRGLYPLFQKTTRRPTRAGCMAHARRRFVRALEAGDARAAIALALIRKLYKIEAQAKDQGLDNAARLALRQSQSVAVMEQLQKELQYLGAQAPPKTLLGQAVGYALRQWQTLQTFLSDGAVRIGRVEHWRGDLRNRGVAAADRFRVLRRCLNPIHRSVSSARSSNRACRSPAHGSPPMLHAFAFDGPISVAGGL